MKNVITLCHPFITSKILTRQLILSPIALAWATDIQLFNHLGLRKTDAIGTVGLNRTGFPESLSKGRHRYS